MTRAEMAKENFISGYNCSQSVVLAFSDLTGVDKDTLLKLSSPFGGGMGRMREVCGAVSGMYIVLGLLEGYSDNKAYEQKKELYKTVQELAERFKVENGSIICREVLKNPSSSPEPTIRDENFYKERPCVKMVMTAADILENYLK